MAYNFQHKKISYRSLIFLIFSKKIIAKQDIIRFVLAGFVGIFAYNLFLNTGQQTVSAGASSFIVNCNPLFASLIGFYILKQKVKSFFYFTKSQSRFASVVF